jgi:hypothetical protein
LAQFHINTDGDVRVCTASVKSCQFADSDHFSSGAGALKASEDNLAREFGTPAKPLRRVRTFIEKAARKLEDFAENVDTGHKQSMEEIRELAYQRKNTTDFK